MKSNFILQPSNVGEFIKRFNRLLNVTGYLSDQTFYNNKKELNNILNISDKRNFLVIKSIKSYFDKNKFELDTYPSTISKELNFHNSEGLILRHHFDACSVYYWRQKFKMTPTQIKTIGCVKIPKYKKQSFSGSTIIQIESNIDKANNEIMYAELCAKQYYDDMYNDLIFDDIGDDMNDDFNEY